MAYFSILRLSVDADIHCVSLLPVVRPTRPALCGSFFSEEICLKLKLT